MFFETRPHAIKAVDDVGELAQKLTEMTWCSCQGFLIGGTLLLQNDSTGPDGVQEYAIIDVDGNKPTVGQHVGSMSVGFMDNDPERILDQIAELLKPTESFVTSVRSTGSTVSTIVSVLDRKRGSEVRINPHPSGYCRLCA